MTNKLVSLDVFDTALFRTVYEPKDIFKYVGFVIADDEFYDRRIVAEMEVAKKKPFYNIYDIYDCEYLKKYGYEPEVEIEVEQMKCVANSKLLQQYNKHPEKYVFISDMYLPSYIIEEMLRSAGYKTPQVFVSCEQKACKGDGSLFKKVEDQLDAVIETHYGDNYVADIEGAKKAGVKNVVFNPAIHNQDFSLPAIKDPTLKKLVALWFNRAPEDKIALYHAPLISEFAKWVVNKQKDGQKIFFLSRDMYMPYIIAKEELKANNVYYIHASRKSLASACLQSNNQQLRERIASLFDADEINLRESEDLSQVREYFKQFNIKDGDIIADIGYAGTIQAGIDSLLGVKTTGLYMQLSDNKIDGINAEMFFSRPVIQYCLLVEMALGSPEDCIEGYKNGKVIFKKENSQRKKLAKRINALSLHTARLFSHMDIDLYDIEQMLIHLQFYPTNDVIELLNKEIYSNKHLGESIIGFNKDKILNGELRECYAKSYAKPLFIKLLEQDRDLKHLRKLLK